MTDHLKELWKDQYEAELARKEHITNGAYFIVNVIGLESAAIFFLLKGSLDDVTSFIGLFYIFMVLSACTLIASCGLLFYGFYNSQTAYLDTPDTLERHLNELRAYDEKSSEARFNEFIVGRYRDSASLNGRQNDKRSSVFFYSRAFLIISVSLFLIAAIIYMGNLIRWCVFDVYS